MMRDPKSGDSDRNQKASSSAAPPNGKEPTPAFSNVTSTMSDCSPNDRPMSDFSPTDKEKSSPVPDSVKSVDADVTSETAKSLSVNAPESNRQPGSTSCEETTEETEETEEEESEDSESARTDEDEEEKEQALITKAAATPKPAPVKWAPGIIYWDAKDSLEQSDPDTGAMRFLKNTVPLTGRRPCGRSRLPAMVIDEGTTSGWPPPEFTPGPAIGPIPPQAMDDYNLMVTDMAERALDWDRPQKVTRDEHHPWPYVAFGRINDLDRSLTELANQMVTQAFNSRTPQEPSKDVSFKERLIQKTKDFMAEVGKKGAAIGKEFEYVAGNFADIVYILEAVQKIAESGEIQHPSTKHDLQLLKTELQKHCQNLKTRLIELKAQIIDYGNFITKYIKDVKNDKPQLEPRSMDPDESEAMAHRSAYQAVKLMLQEIESDSINDKTGIFKRWYEQSRLRQLLEFMNDCASRAIREAEELDRAKKAKPPPPISKATTADGSNRLIQGPELLSADDTDVDDDQFDFYSARERKPIYLARMAGDIDQKKETKEIKPPSAKFDFYSAPEPYSDV